MPLPPPSSRPPPPMPPTHPPASNPPTLPQTPTPPAPTLRPYREGRAPPQALARPRPRSQCARGAFCAINLEGYSIPNGTTILAAPESGFGVPAYTCRDIAGSTFAGYREFVLTNPGVTPFVRWPLEEQGDLTTNVLMDMGQALGMGSRHLCLCYGGLACNQPSRFKLDVGMMIIRSALGEELFTCQMGTGADCKISVRGKYLLGNDTIAIARIDQECRTIFDSPTGVPHLQTMPFQTPLAKAVAVTSVNGTVPGEDWVAEFNIGQAHRIRGPIPGLPMHNIHARHVSEGVLCRVRQRDHSEALVYGHHEAEQWPQMALMRLRRAGNGHAELGTCRDSVHWHRCPQQSRTSRFGGGRV